MHGGGGFNSGGFDPTRKPEGAKAIVRDRLEGRRSRGRMGGLERWLFTVIALGIALAVIASIVIAAVV